MGDSANSVNENFFRNLYLLAEYIELLGEACFVCFDALTGGLLNLAFQVDNYVTEAFWTKLIVCFMFLQRWATKCISKLIMYFKRVDDVQSPRSHAFCECRTGRGRNLDIQGQIDPCEVELCGRSKEEIILGRPENQALALQEILELTFKYLDEKDLRSCRLVNKLWNMEATHAIRPKTTVHLHASDELELQNFFQLVKASLHLNMPSILSEYSACIDAWGSTAEALTSVEGADLIKLNLYANPGDGDFRGAIRTILTKNAYTLTTFCCSLSNGFNFGWSFRNRTTLNLPALKNLEFYEWESSPKNSCVNFLCQIFEAAPNVSSLKMQVEDENLLLKLFKRVNFSKILRLQIEHVSQKQLQVLASRKLFMGLHTLKLRIHPEEEHLVESSVITGAIEMHAESLVNLCLHWEPDSPTMSFPRCPQLRVLYLDGWNGPLQSFTGGNLPNLTSFFVQNYSYFDDLTTYMAHEGLKKFGYISHSREASKSTLVADEEFACLFQYAKGQFPNVTSLELVIPVSNEILTLIILHFPLLRKLLLNTRSNISEYLFTGYNKFYLEQHEQNGLDLELMQKLPCLVDLKYLQFLATSNSTYNGINKSVIVSKNAIVHGVAKMPSLRAFQFYWNPMLSVTVVAGSLQHLKTLKLTNASRIKTVVKQLKQHMPLTIITGPQDSFPVC